MKFIQYIFVTFLLLGMIGKSISTFAQSTHPNFKSVSQIRIPVQQISQLDNLNANEKQAASEYYDGLGRVIQKVAHQSSPSQGDVVEPIEYDAFGRNIRSYLPYQASSAGGFHTDADVAQAQFYQSANDVAHDDFPYSDVLLENSPLGRKLEQAAPGAQWQLQGVAAQSFSYRPSTASDMIAFFDSAFEVGHQILQGYGARCLRMTETTDENGFRKREFLDFQGNKVFEKREVQAGTWAETYYVYDDARRLVRMIQPEGREMFDQTSGMLTEELIEQYVFLYDYDEKGRIIHQKSPSADTIQYVYDALDRPILMQDGNLQQTGGWLFTKYDQFGREIMTGKYLNPLGLDRAALQALVDAQYAAGSIQLYESRTANNFLVHHGYSEEAFPPLTACELFTVNYYDSYDLNLDQSVEASYLADTSIFPNNQPILLPKNQLTATKEWITNPDSDMPQSIIGFYFYDKYNRLIQTQTENHLNGMERMTYGYDFVGNKVKQLYEHSIEKPASSPGGTASIESHNIYESFEYDHANRLLKHWQSMDGANEVLLADLAYNEIGQLIQKKLHSTNFGISALQSIDYQYDIHGWLTHINQPKDRGPAGFSRPAMPVPNTNISAYSTVRTPPGSQSNTIVKDVPRPGGLTNQNTTPPSTTSISPNTQLGGFSGRSQSSGGLLTSSPSPSNPTPTTPADLFAMELIYEQGLADLNADPLYNGNISAIKWETASDGEVRAYGFQYDGLNRLKEAKFAALTYNQEWLRHTNRYSVQGINYDLNGNILSMNRLGMSGQNANNQPTWGMMDELSYAHRGNQLIRAHDGANTANMPLDAVEFIDGVNLITIPAIPTTHEYVYDAAGNLINDKNRNLLIRYNVQNLPTEIIFQNTQDTIRWIYSATGTKLRKLIARSNGTQERQDYVGLFFYVDENVRFCHTEEGYAQYDGSNFQYIYHLKDHLGNIRLSFTDADANGKPEIVQEDHYYPFGLQMNGLTRINGTRNDFLFGGKEHQDELGLNYYDFGARYYDPTISRWLMVDPLSEERAAWTGYRYGYNNPIYFRDPSGLIETDYHIHEDGTIDVVNTDDDFNRYYYETGDDETVFLGEFSKNSEDLVQLPSFYSFSDEETGLSLGFSVKSGNEDRAYIRSDALASLFGALISTATNDLTVVGFSLSNGSSPKPSISHIDGKNGDLRYLRTDESGNSLRINQNPELLDTERQNGLNDALYKYGWKDMVSYKFKQNGESKLLNHTRHLKHHHNHLHLQGYKPTLNVIK